MDSARILTIKDDLAALEKRILSLQSREYLAPFERREIIRLKAQQRRLAGIIAAAEAKQMRII